MKRHRTSKIVVVVAIVLVGGFAVWAGGVAQVHAGARVPDNPARMVLHATVGDGGSDSAVTYLDMRFDDGTKVMIGGAPNTALIQKLKEFAESHQTLTLTITRGPDESSEH